MRLHNMFKKTGEKITSIHSRNRRKPEAPEGILKKCNKCGAAILTDEVINGKYICPKCHGYFRIPAYKRIELVTDAGSFEEWDAKIDEGERPENPLDFRGYTEKVDAMNKIMEAGLCEHPGGGAMLTGVGSDQNQAYRTYPCNEEEWAMYGDYNIPALGWEPNYNLLKRANEDYNSGITDPEYYIIDSETAKANFVNGKSYSYSGYVSASTDFLNAFYDQNPDGKLAITPISSEVDESGEDGIVTVPAWRAENPFGMIVGFSNTATEDELKAAWMYMEWLSQPENLYTFQWGIEGENYNLDEEGNPVTVSDYNGDYKQGFNNSKDYWCIVKEKRTFDTVEENIKADTPQDLPQNFTDDIIKYYYDRLAIADQYGLSDCQFSVVIAAQSEYQNTLGELYKEFRDALTMCKPEEFDAMYEDYAQQYADQGYQEVVDERLEAFQAGNSTRLPENQKAADAE